MYHVEWRKGGGLRQLGEAGITAGPPPGHQGKCPTSGSQDSTERAKGHLGSKNAEKIKVLKWNSA